jgi:hypothetical protein
MRFFKAPEGRIFCLILSTLMGRIAEKWLYERACHVRKLRFVAKSMSDNSIRFVAQGEAVWPLADRCNRVRFQELMRKHSLSEEMLDQIFGKLRRSDMLALRRLWEQDKLPDMQFMRPSEEVYSFAIFYSMAGYFRGII